MCQYGFIAGQDFTPKSGKTSEAGGRPRIDHIISLEMAKEIFMIQRSPLGKQARQYFIECERRARNNVPALSGPELVARALIEAQNMLEEKDQQIKELAPRAGAWETFCESPILLKRLRPVVVFCALIIGGLVGVVLGDVVEVF